MAFLAALFSACIIVYFVSPIYFKNLLGRNEKIMYENNIGYFTKTNDKSLQIYNGSRWEDFKIKGVKITSSLPGYEYGQQAIKKDIYLKWMKQIFEMNANVILTEEIQSPAFYDAFYEFNRNNAGSLYLIQGINIDNEVVSQFYDGHNKAIKDKFKNDVRLAIDVIHGKSFSINKREMKPYIYNKDISRYVIGYIFGSSLNPEFIKLTNLKNTDISSYSGKYIYTKNTDAFECLMGEVSDYAVDYETSEYEEQRLISFSSSIELDPLSHNNEPMEKRDVDFDMESLQLTDRVRTGIFASYVVYPNHPDFMSFSNDYLEFRDENGGVNPYLGYLTKLNQYYKIPMIISEVGVSTSRGMSKVDHIRGYNRGGIDENKQGKMLVALLKDIYKSGAVGAIINNWQDEWGKKTTWNTKHMLLHKDAGINYDPQSSEQSFGLLAFEAGKNHSVCYIDGNVEDWAGLKPVTEAEGLKVYIQSDINYLYLRAEKENLNFNSDELYIGIDIISPGGSKYDAADDVSFDIPADFVIKIKGMDKSSVLVHSRYDIFDFNYKYYSNILEKINYAPTLNNSDFNPVNLMTQLRFYLDDSKKTIEPSYYQTGSLAYGISNPESGSFYSLSDFYSIGNNIEIRIPWSMLNVINPEKGMAYNDFYRFSYTSTINVESLNVSTAYKAEGKQRVKTGQGAYKIKRIRRIDYHERLKKSYEHIKDYFAAFK